MNSGGAWVYLQEDLSINSGELESFKLYGT